ncbi:MAG TPA: DUF5107 domain-containing protein [Armatimonadota bacterium]|nr:DUF5107 domain-containing protein [Armatimonadota bacterium]
MPCQWRTENINLRTEKIAPPDSPALSGRAHSNRTPGRLLHKAADVSYNAVILWNRFLEVTVLPELGGRIYRARRIPDNQDLFLFKPAIIPTYLHSLGFVGGLEFGLPAAPGLVTFSSLPWRIVDGESGSVTLRIGGVGSSPNQEWAVGIRLRDGSAALEIEVWLTNTGRESCECGFVSTAYLNNSESLVLLGAPALPLDSGRDPGESRETASGSDPCGIFPGTTIALPSGEPGIGLYDTRLDVALLHVVERGARIGRQACFFNDSGTLRLWGEITGVGPMGFCEFRSIMPAPAAPPVLLAPGEQARWTERWVGLAGIGAGGIDCCRTLSSGVVTAGPCRGQNADLRLPLTGRAADTDFDRAELAERIRITASAWESAAPLVASVKCGGEVIWSDSLAPGPGETCERVVDAPITDECEIEVRDEESSLRCLVPGGVSGVLRVVDPPSVDGDGLRGVTIRSLDRVSQGFEEARRRLTIAMRTGGNPESEGLMRALIEFSPLDPVASWLERRNGSWPWETAHLGDASPVFDGSVSGHSGTEALPTGLNPEAMWLINVGRIFDSLGLDEADEAYEEALRAGLPMAGYRRGARAARSGDVEGARHWFEEAARLPLDVQSLMQDGDRNSLELALERPAWTTLYYLGAARLSEESEGEDADVSIIEARALLERALDLSPPGGEDPSLLRALAACLWRPGSRPSAAADEEHAAMLLDRAIENAPHDEARRLERDRLAEVRGEPLMTRLARLHRAPADVRLNGVIALRMAELLVETGAYDDAIRLLNAATVDPLPGEPGAWKPYSRARLARALGRMAVQEFEGALADLEAAMEYPMHLGDPAPARPQHTELRWWAGEASWQLGRSFSARAYWQSAASRRHQPESPLAPIRALAIRRLGGEAQARGLLEETLRATEPRSPAHPVDDVSAFIVAQTSEQGANAPPDDPEASFARALALAAVGDRDGALKILDMLRTIVPAYAPAVWYRPVVAAGLIDADSGTRHLDEL